MATTLTPAAPFVYQWDDGITQEVLHPGQHFTPDHPAVRKHPACFIDINDLPKHGEVESARQNPGEQRNTRRPA